MTERSHTIQCRATDEHRLDAHEVLDQILVTGVLRDIPGVPDRVRRLFVTANEMGVEQHLQIQQAFQRHVDNAVSKTINLPEDADQDQAAHAYLEAWRLGLKGVTIYRSGSKAGQILSLGVDDDSTAAEFFAKCDPGACRL